MLLFSDMDYALVDSLMQEFEQKGSLKIPEDLHMKVSYYHDTLPSNTPCTPFLEVTAEYPVTLKLTPPKGRIRS